VDAFAALMAIRGQIDFDDLVVGAVAALRATRSFASLGRPASATSVDEFQDVDAAQRRGMGGEQEVPAGRSEPKSKQLTGVLLGH
jgi:hypothetical protein